MRGKHQSIINWLDPAHRLPTKIYLDATIHEEFANWIADKSKSDPRVAQNLQEKNWHVLLFRDQLNRIYGSRPKRDKALKAIGIDIVNASKPAKITSGDELFISEVLRVYFNNDNSARRYAELLLLARQHAGNDWITVITQHRGFWRIPMVNSYHLDFASLLGSDDLPASFDFIHDFSIHSFLARAIASQLDNTQYGQVIFDAIIALQDHIRLMSSLTNDGHNLMNQAFNPQNPILKLNPLTDPDPRGTQQNEQKGFHQIYCGIIPAIRNPLAHEGPSSYFAQNRYPDKRTMLKVLGFLSILGERADRALS